MKKLERVLIHIYAWKQWHKYSTAGWWYDFLVLIGVRKHVMFHIIETQICLDTIYSILREKLDVKSPSGNYEPKLTSTDNLDGYKVQMSFYDELNQPKS